MTGRRNHTRTPDEEIAEYRSFQQIERGEKVYGNEAMWLDSQGPAARAGLRGDALTRHRRSTR